MKLIINKHILKQGRIKLTKRKKFLLWFLNILLNVILLYKADIYVLINL